MGYAILEPLSGLYAQSGRSSLGCDKEDVQQDDKRSQRLSPDGTMARGRREFEENVDALGHAYDHGDFIE